MEEELLKDYPVEFAKWIGSILKGSKKVDMDKAYQLLSSKRLLQLVLTDEECYRSIQKKYYSVDFTIGSYAFILAFYPLSYLYVAEYLTDSFLYLKVTNDQSLYIGHDYKEGKTISVKVPFTKKQFFEVCELDDHIRIVDISPLLGQCFLDKDQKFSKQKIMKLEQ